MALSKGRRQRRTQGPVLEAGRVTSMRRVMVMRPEETEAARACDQPRAWPQRYLREGERERGEREREREREREKHRVCTKWVSSWTETDLPPSLPPSSPVDPQPYQSEKDEGLHHDFPPPESTCGCDGFGHKRI